MNIHASQLARPMVCAGFMFLDLPKFPAGEAAEEGTAAGEYLENMLLEKPLGSTASNGVFIDEDIKFHTTDVYNNIIGRAKSPVLCEQKIDWQTRSGIWIRGKYDAAYVDVKGRLCIDDLKYGWGIVEVKENWQLLAYAIGEVIRRGQAFNEIVLRILQPRPHHEDGNYREWTLSYSTLLEYKEKIELRMIELNEGRKDLQTSDKCKYCPGAAEACPAFSRLFYRALEVTTEFCQDSLTNQELSFQLDQIKRAEEVIKIKRDSLTELGTMRIKQGEIIPNYVHVANYGHRAWKNGISPDSIKAMTGLNVVDTVFMTPAKAEKVGVSKELIAQLTEKKFSGYKLEKKNVTELGNKIFGTNNPQGGI